MMNAQPQVTENTYQCTILTKKGTRCKFLKVYARGRYEEWCSLHNPNKPPKKELSDEKRCTHILKNGKRCSKKKYCSKKGETLKTCISHIVLLPKEEALNPKIKEINVHSTYFTRYPNIFTNFFSTYDHSRTMTSIHSWVIRDERKLSIPQKESLEKLKKIKMPLLIPRVMSFIHISSSVNIFRERSGRCFVYSKPEFRYFVLLQKAYLLEETVLFIYDRKKCEGNIKKFEAMVSFPSPFNPDKDILFFLSENVLTGKLLLSVERSGLTTEKLDINVFNKTITSIPIPEKKYSYYFSEEEIATSVTFEDYIFKIKKTPEGVKSIEQSFIDSGMKLCRYSVGEKCTTPKIVFGYDYEDYGYKRNEKMEIQRNFYIVIGMGKKYFLLERFALDHPLRILNEARIVGMLSGKVGGEYFSFVTKKIIVSSLRREYTQK